MMFQDDFDDLEHFSIIPSRRPISAKHSKAARRNMAKTNQGLSKSPKWLRQLKHQRKAKSNGL